MFCHGTKNPRITGCNTVVQIGTRYFRLHGEKQRQINRTHRPQEIRKDNLTVFQIIAVSDRIQKILPHQQRIQGNIFFLEKGKQYIPLDVLIQNQTAQCLILFFFQPFSVQFLAAAPVHIVKIKFIDRRHIFRQFIGIFSPLGTICRNCKNHKFRFRKQLDQAVYPA